MNNNLENQSINVDASKFKFVNSFEKTRFDQIVGKPSTYIKDIFKRFIKNPYAMIFTAIFIILIMFMIFVPITSQFSAYKPISENEWAQNLRPRWPGGLISGKYFTTLNQSQFDKYSNSDEYKGFIVNPNNIQYVGALIYTEVNPYALPELKNFFPLFGTDDRGIDIWTQTWVGAGKSFLIALGVAIISIIIGATYGAISGAFAGKWIDTIMMRVIEILSGVPTILWLLILAIIFTNTGTPGALNNQSLFLALIAIMWMRPAALTRIYILKQKDLEYVQAVRTLGGSEARIIFIHMLPNIAGRLAVRFVHIIPSVIFFESTLVFLGLKNSSELGLGTLINNGNGIQDYISPLLLPALIMVLLMLSAQIIANGLNDAIDPRVDARK